MNRKHKTYSFLFGHFAITVQAFQRLNLLDLYVATLRHASGRGVLFSPLPPAGRKPFWRERNRHTTTHRDRHGTPFWVITEPDLSRTTILLPEEY